MLVSMFSRCCLLHCLLVLAVGSATNMRAVRSSMLKAASSDIITFGGIKFHEPLSSLLTQMGIRNTPSPIQVAALPSLCSGLSCILHASTGSGKTFAYLLPALKRIYSSAATDRKSGQVWIVAPTHELVTQIEHDIHLLTNDKSIVSTFTRQKTKRRLAHQQEPSIAKIVSPIVVGTPARLLELILSEKGKEYSSHIDYLVLDEVDRLIPIHNRYLSHSSTTKKRSLDSAKQATLNMFSCLLDYQAKMQIVCASATVGRQLWRAACHLVAPLIINADTKFTSKESMESFPIIRPAEAYSLNIESRNQAAMILKNIQKENQLRKRQGFFQISQSHEYQLSDEKQMQNQITKSTRYIGIPSSIKHYLLVDDTHEESSLAKRLSLFNKMLKKTLHSSSQRILLFLPESTDIDQAINILKFWRNDNIFKVNEARQILNQQGESSSAASPIIVVAAFSGTRGLHLPGIDTVFVTKPPKSMDEYLHLAGRTGRLECTSKVQGYPAQNVSQVITIVDFEEIKRMTSWQTPLGISLNYFTKL